MFNLTNPFRRADKHGASDMRPTAPASAEMPMQSPVNQTITLPSAMVPAMDPRSEGRTKCGCVACFCPFTVWVSVVVCYPCSIGRHGNNQATDFHGRETGIARD